MKTSAKIFLACTLPVAVCLTAPAQPQDNTEALRVVVIKLHTHFTTNKKDETAAGLYVGKDRRYAYFITARHAIVDEVGNEEVHAQSADVWFRGSPQTVKAMVFDRTDPILDLGVVYLPVGELPANIHPVVKKDPAVNVSVVVIGHPAGGDWSVWPGTILNENAPNGDVHHFITTSNGSLAHGDSGGPVLDVNGNFIGMHTETTASYGRAAKSGEILIQLAAWNVPTDNVLDIPLVPDPQVIKKVLASYEEAYNRRDANALWKVWPNPPAKTKHSIEMSFQDALSIEMRIYPGEPQIMPDGMNATVRGRLSQIYTPRKGSPQPQRSDEFVFALKKNNGVWTIVEIK